MMKLTGRILVKETNQGVANLLVVAYDANCDTAPQLLNLQLMDIVPTHLGDDSHP